MEPLISFCSQCKGRTHHLKETLLNNLQNIARYSNLDYVLLDFDSDDGLLDWIQTDIFKPYLDSNILKYFRVENQPYYLQSAVKNLSHRLSTGVNIINVDADNSLTNKYVTEVINIFSTHNNAIIKPEIYELIRGKDDVDESCFKYFGTFGRIGMPRKIYDYILGYDEIFVHWGAEDDDLISRLYNLNESENNIKLDFFVISNTTIGPALEHDNESRITNYSADNFKDKKENFSNLSKLTMNVHDIREIFKKENYEYVNDTISSKLIKSRIHGQKFSVMQLVNMSLINIGNI